MTEASPASRNQTPVEQRSKLLSVAIRNYKSIGKCRVELGGLTVVVGRNGAGKSNFLDALAFVADGLQSSLDHAIRARGGVEAVRRLSTGHPRNFAINMELELPEFRRAVYGFEIAARGQGAYGVKQERLRIYGPSGRMPAWYDVRDGVVVDSQPKQVPPAAADRLYLVSAASLPEFRPVYEAIMSMGFYNLNPAAMKEPQSADAGELLRRDGSNIASVIARLEEDSPDLFERVKQYLKTIVQDIKGVARVPLGPRETLEFRQEVRGAKHPWRFYAASMSDGTLRTLGALVAATQLIRRAAPVMLVGIEEPEAALHPAAAGALVDALREAAEHTQVLVTTHSPDLLEQLELPPDRLLAAVSREGTTSIAPIDEASRKAIQSHLYTAGELLRMYQLEPDAKDIQKQKQWRLFDDEGNE